MKIFSVHQIKACDEFTIQHEPVSSLDLMERAGGACVKYILRKLQLESEFAVFCGKGNNGGDGLVIARQLLVRGFAVKVYVVNYSDANGSADFQANLLRLKETKEDAVSYVGTEQDLPGIEIGKHVIVIDALLGSGLNKPLSGLLAQTVEFINRNKRRTISIDMPTGLYADKPNEKEESIIHADLVLTFQFPKLSFLLPQNRDYVPEFEVLDIGLSPEYIANEKTSAYYVTKADLRPLLKHRNKFSHKGNFGHALLVAGSYGKMGAAVMAAKACLRSGPGLLTVHVPARGVDILQTSVPEAMVSIDGGETQLTSLPKLDAYNALAIGPGIGTGDETAQIIKQALNYGSQPLLLDADALNMLSQNKTLLSFLPANTILTPHVKEFDRLTGPHDNDFERMESARQFSVKYRSIVVLKGAFTQIHMPDGNVFFNSTGNAGLAKGGSGDILTGIILGLLARGYSAPQAALIGVYLHGLAADACLKKMHIESILATDVIARLPKAFEKLYRE